MRNLWKCLFVCFGAAGCCALPGADLVRDGKAQAVLWLLYPSDAGDEGFGVGFGGSRTVWSKQISCLLCTGPRLRSVIR